MAMDDNIDTHPAKKMKLQEEEIPKSQHGTDTVNLKDPERKVRYIISLNLKHIRQQRASGGDSMSLFRKVMKDAGCCDSQIYQEVYTIYSFAATLTPHEAKKLSDLDSVRGVKPEMKLCFDNRLYV